MNRLMYFGHSCFQLSNKQGSILFDPFLTDNPFQIAQAEEMECNFILVSHGHSDHLGDAAAIAKRNGATIISTAEIAFLCGEQGCQHHAMHIGGKHTFDFGEVRITQAFHGAGIPGGHACGFIVNFYGTVLYFAGDTGIFGDMALLGRLQKIDYALLPIGDNFTMGPQEAGEAAGLLQPRFVVPMHYNTWPIIAQSPAAFKQAVETNQNIAVRVMQPGESMNLE